MHTDVPESFYVIFFCVIIKNFHTPLCVRSRAYESTDACRSHTQVNMCVEAKGRFECHSSDTTHLFWIQCLSLAWNSPSGLGWLGTCPCLPGVLLLVFTWGVGIKFRFSCKANISLAELSPQSQPQPLKRGEVGAGEMAQWSKAEYLGSVPSPDTMAHSCL